MESMTDMATDKLESFKADFTKRLDEFMRDHAKEIGDPREWKLKGWRKGEDRAYLVFIKPAHGAYTYLHMPVSHAPGEFPQEDAFSLRQFMYAHCAEKGFQQKQARISLPSDIIDGVRRGDHESWNRFVEKHRPGFVRDTKRWLEKTGDASILDAEDVTQRALYRLFKGIQQQPLRKDSRPQSLVYLHLREPIPHKLARQPEGIDPDSTPAKAENPLAEQLPEILEKAKESMTERQREILNIILTSNEKLSREEMGKIHGVSTQRISQQMNKIMDYIHRAARALGHEEAAHEIDRLIRANSKGRTIRG